MISLIIALSCAVVTVGGVALSKKKHSNTVSSLKSTQFQEVEIGNSFNEEVERFQQFQQNIIQVKNNANNIQLTMPQPSNYDDAESALGKVSAFFEKHSLAVSGIDGFVSGLLSSEMIVEAFKVVAETTPQAFANAFLAGKETFDSFHVSGHEYLAHFKDTLIQDPGTAKDLIQGGFDLLFKHETTNDFIKAVVKTGWSEAGLKDSFVSAKNSFTETFHDIDFHSLGSEVDLTSISNGIDVADHLDSAGEINFDSLDSVDISDGGSGFHVPYVTLALSTFREAKLLYNAKTDAMTSLKNIGLDAAGSGVGGFAGAKVGALIGTAICPGIGSVIGGAIGGIAGGIGGRALTNNIKQKPLREAIDSYQKQAQIMQNETNEHSRLMVEEISNYTVKVNDKFNEAKKAIPVMTENSIITGVAIILYQVMCDYIIKSKKSLKKLEGSFWSSEEDKKLAKKMNDRFDCAYSLVPDITKINQDPCKAIEVMSTLKLPRFVDLEAKFIKKYIKCKKDFKTVNDFNKSAVLAWSVNLNSTYRKSINDIIDFSNEKMKRFNNFVKTWKTKLTSYEEKVNYEKGKLGMA